MSASVQAKLLRVLKESTFMRLGGTRPIKVDVRLVAATNADLKEAVARGAFREDLYYRLNVVPLYIPPLRERKEDIVPLALDLLQHFNVELRKRFTGFTPAAAELLQQYPWPGNIRELKNVIERTMILAPEGDIDGTALPEEIREHVRAADASAKNQNDSPSELDISPTGRQLLTLREVEDEYIRKFSALPETTRRRPRVSSASTHIALAETQERICSRLSQSKDFITDWLRVFPASSVLVKPEPHLQ